MRRARSALPSAFASAFASAVAWAVAGCGAPPAPAPVATPSASEPSSASDIDPISGLPREAAPKRFAPPAGEHLCKANEEVVFACTLEGPSPQALTSLCLQKGSSRKDPVVIGRERVDGRTEEPLGGGPSGHAMISVLEAADVPFSVEVEQRTDAGAFGAEKQTHPKAPGKAPRYRRNITTGKEGAPGTKSVHAACDPAHPITDNFDAMRAYKL